MLIEQIIGAASAQLVKRALRLGAAEPRAIGGGFLIRPLSCRALLELFQIDQIPHTGPRHAGSVVVATMQSIDGGVQISVELAAAKLGGYALVSSILIYEIPHYASDSIKYCVAIYFRNNFAVPRRSAEVKAIQA
jgi:hypothetical protein